jgi:ABC-type uncharacterized transport system substrate-binding protein
MLNIVMSFYILSGAFIITSVYLLRKIIQLIATRNYLQEKKKRIVIAVMLPNTIKKVLELRCPLIAYLKKYASFEFETIECIHNVNREQAEEWAHFISESKVDLVLAIGTMSTDIMYNTMKTSQVQIPILSIGSPLSNTQTSFDTMQQNAQITGIVTTMGWPAKINLLKRILPHVKNVLIVVRSIDEISHNDLKEKNLITTSLRKHQIAWKMHHAPAIEKSADFNAQLLENVDIIILSLNIEILKYASRIAYEAQKFNTPVFSPDISCPDVFLCVSQCPERTISIQSAKYAIEILEDGMNTSSLPIKEIKEHEKIVLYPRNTSPMIATTAIGNLLTQSNIIHLNIQESGE